MKNRLLALQLEIMTQSPVVNAMKKSTKTNVEKVTETNQKQKSSHHDKFLPIIGRVLRNGNPISGIEVNFVEMIDDFGNRMSYTVNTSSSVTNQNGEFYMGLSYDGSNFAEVSQATVVIEIQGTHYNINTHTGVSLNNLMGVIFPSTTYDAILTLLGARNPMSLLSTNFVAIAAIGDVTIP